MDGIQRVREELKAIRQTNKMSIKFMRVEEVLNNKAKILGDVNPRDIQILAETKEEVKKCISLTAEMEAKYILAFNQLAPLDRHIILSRAIVCQSYAMIGYEIGYSEDRIRMKIYNIYNKLNEILYNSKKG